MQMKFKHDSLFSDLKKSRLGMIDYQNSCEEKQIEIENFKTQLHTLHEENQRMNQEHIRILGVNKTLEQQIQIQGSDINTLQTDIDAIMGGNNMD